MKVVTRVCIEDTEFVDGDERITLKRGDIYTTAPTEKDGKVFVFTRYWFWAPANIFAGEKPL